MPNEPFDVLLLPGIRQDVDPLVAPKGMLVDAMNVRYGRAGGIYPRLGTRNVGPSTTTASHVIQGSSEMIGPLGSVAGLSVAGVGGKLFARDTQGGRFDYLGRYSAFRPVKQWVVPWRSGLQFRIGAVAVNSDGYVAVVGITSDPTPTRELWIFAPDGTPVGTESGTDAQTSHACVFAIGTSFVFVTEWAGSINASFFTYNNSASNTFERTNIATVASPVNGFFDACAAANGTEWFLIHQSGATTLTVNRFLGAVSQASLTQAVVGDCPVSISADSSNVWIGWHNDPTVSGEVQYRAATTSLSGYSAAAVTIATGTTFGEPLIGSNSSGTNKVAVFRRSLDNVSPYTVATGRALISTSAVVEAVGYMWHARPISKPVLGRAWCMTGCDATNWTTERHVLVNFEQSLTSQATPGLAFPELSGPPVFKLVTGTLGTFSLFSDIAVGSSSYYMAAPLALGTEVAQIVVYEYESSAQAAHRQLQNMGSNGVITTGQPQHVPSRGVPRVGTSMQSDATYSRLAEVGFVYPPAVLAHTSDALGGDMTPGGTYSYLVTFEYQDGVFERHRSGVSAPYAVTMGASDTEVTLTVTHPDITHRDSTAIVAYRTVSGGTTYHRLPRVPVFQYDSATGTYALVDQDSDSDISDNEIVYVDGGVKDNALAPSCIFSCKTETRLVLGGLWDGRIVQVSKIIVPNEPVQFTDDPSFQIVLPEACTGLAYQDGSIVAFAENAIYVVSGDGPNDQGIGQFTDARAICRDVGCADYRSILETAQGILFKSERGFYLLPRGNGNPLFVGAAVQRFVDATVEDYASTLFGNGYVNVLGAVTVSTPRERTARFLVQTGDGDTIELVYDLDIAANDPLNGWSYNTYAVDLGAIGLWPAGVVLARAGLSSATSTFYVHDGAFKTDASDTEDIESTAQTAQIRPGGLAGEVRVMSVVGLMSNTDGGTATLDLLIDDLAAEQAGSQTLTASTGSIYREVSCGQVADCTAFAVRMSSARTGAILGPTFHGFTANIQPSGSTRLTDSTER